ncbi:hypothetical protein [Blastochloris viridis]|nr:hypothetical protein [Blastochloris viridis]
MSLLSRPQLPLFEDRELSREDYLRKVFNEERIFSHHSIAYHYVPDSGGRKKDAVLGRIGRRVIVEENLPPEDGFADSTYETHRAAALVLDPTSHPDGQKLAIQNRVGSPTALANSLIKAINFVHSQSIYHIEIQPIFDAKEFWQWASENQGDVTSLTFEFVAPNGMWSTETDLKDELRSFHESIGSDSIQQTFKSCGGLKLDSPKIVEAVEYVQSGSGSISARSRRNKKFSSKKKPKSIVIPPSIEVGSGSLLERAYNRIREILGRE